jgi:hypothetical protein
MRLPISKSKAIMVGALLLFVGLIVAAERGSEPTRRDASARGSNSVRPRGSSSPKTCPTETVVEDPALITEASEYVKTRFTTNTCWRTAAGDLNSCLDPDEAACTKRLAGMKALIRKAGECVARPSEVYCAVYVRSNGRPNTLCYETKGACDDVRTKKKMQAGTCRITPACERVALPAL